MKIDMLSFTEAGYEMAQTIRNALEERPLLNPGESPRLTVTVSRCNQPLSLGEWTGQMFDQTDALVYVGAAGIAVRAIAPFVKSKVTDPAVVVVDEGGSFAIPVLSGHLGGANDLARAIAERTRATAVITKASSSRTPKRSKPSPPRCWRARRCTSPPNGPLRAMRRKASSSKP